MRKQLLCAALLAAAAASAQAQETTWQFTFLGFIDPLTGVFNPRTALTGTFTGSDNDSNGIITANELTGLSSAGRTYIAPNGEGCVDSWSPYARCTVNSFSYALTGELTYSIGYSGNDEFSRSWSGTYITGSHFVTSASDWSLGEYSETRYNWSELTELFITPPPAPVLSAVPEPSIALLLPAGLAVLLAGRRRRQ